MLSYEASSTLSLELAASCAACLGMSKKGITACGAVSAIVALKILDVCMNGYIVSAYISETRELIVAKRAFKGGPTGSWHGDGVNFDPGVATNEEGRLILRRSIAQNRIVRRWRNRVVQS